MYSSAVIIIFAIFFVGVENCNEANCGSIVSKCLLTESCNCDLKAQTCSRECFNCLGDSYTECCSCLDLCPTPKDDDGNLGKSSNVEDFRDPVPQLFRALTDYPDQMGQFISHVVPMKIDIKLPEKMADDPNKLKELTLNCTVAFWSTCRSWRECKIGCLSMGSSSYRWFHDGCCECIGESCINYGLNESRCKNCPVKNIKMEKKEEEEEEEEDLLDYGEDDDMLEYEE